MRAKSVNEIKREGGTLPLLNVGKSVVTPAFDFIMKFDPLFDVINHRVKEDQNWGSIKPLVDKVISILKRPYGKVILIGSVEEDPRLLKMLDKFFKDGVMTEYQMLNWRGVNWRGVNVNASIEHNEEAGILRTFWITSSGNHVTYYWIKIK